MLVFGILNGTCHGADDIAKTMTIEEVSRDMLSLEGQLIRLVFNYRNSIIEYEKGKFVTSVYDLNSRSVFVDVPANGVSAIEKIPARPVPYWGKAKSVEQLYVIVGLPVTSTNRNLPFYANQPTPRVTAVGRSAIKDVSGDIQYLWSGEKKMGTEIEKKLEGGLK